MNIHVLTVFVVVRKADRLHNGISSLMYIHSFVYVSIPVTELHAPACPIVMNGPKLFFEVF